MNINSEGFGDGSKKTWMEINYANQYGTTPYDNTDFYIVEIHRYINHKAIHPHRLYNATQEDFPKSRE